MAEAPTTLKERRVDRVMADVETKIDELKDALAELKKAVLSDEGEDDG